LLEWSKQADAALRDLPVIIHTRDRDGYAFGLVLRYQRLAKQVQPRFCRHSTFIAAKEPEGFGAWRSTQRRAGRDD
jgi:hypothetical protein